MNLLPLSIYGMHTIRSDFIVLGNLYVHNIVTASDFSNRNGLMTINDIITSDNGSIQIDKSNMVVKISMNFDTMIRVNDDGKIDISYDPPDFELNEQDGKLQLVQETFKGLGAIEIKTNSDSDWSDWLLEDLDISIPKLRAIKLKTSALSTQDNRTLDLK